MTTIVMCGNNKANNSQSKCVKDGVYTDYHSNGAVYIVCNYVNNTIHGEYYEYHANGEIYTHCNYINGLIVGDFKQFFDNKQIYVTCNYNSDGKRNGSFYQYHKNGSIHIVCNYINGAIEGKHLTYYSSKEGPTGPLEVECNYTRNENNISKIDGEHIVYNLDGSLFWKSIYHDGKMSDTSYQYSYNKNGEQQISIVYYFENNQRTKMIKYYPDGQVHITGEYNNVNSCYNCQEFYQNGNHYRSFDDYLFLDPSMRLSIPAFRKC